MQEIWKTVPIMGNNYEVSNLGKIRVKERAIIKNVYGKSTKQIYNSRLLKGSIGKWGHIIVHLGYNKHMECYQVGRLVLLAFIGVPTDNRIENLRWDTHKENNRDRIKHGTYARGIKHHFSKYSEGIIFIIRNKIMSKAQAFKIGVSNTHYYRILKGER